MMYQVIFNGQLVNGLSRQQALENLNRLTGQPFEQLSNLFFRGLGPIVVKRNIDHQTALNLMKRLLQSGLKVTIAPMEAPAPKPAEANPERETTAKPGPPLATLPPPRTGFPWMLALAAIACVAIGINAIVSS